jgi:hypothetical protein
VLESKRYLGLELAGAKNLKTALAVLEYYPKEKKTFLLDIFDKIAAHKPQSADDALLEVIREFHPGITRMGVNVPLELPPCITCTKKTCPMPGECGAPSVKWMRDFTRKALKLPRGNKVLDFTPYTQRPIELWMRYQVLSKLSEFNRFDIDETLGGNKAPLTARMYFLKRHLRDIDLVEVWPKLSVAILAEELKLSRRTMSSYRSLEEGSFQREEILQALAEAHGIFIYDRDIRKLSLSLTAFDAFICAYTALLADTGRCMEMPNGFPVSTGWVEYPALP